MERGTSPSDARRAAALENGNYARRLDEQTIIDVANRSRSCWYCLHRGD